MFWQHGTLTTFTKRGLVMLLVGESIHDHECENTETATQAKTQERQASFTGVEMVDSSEDDWEGFKKAKYYGYVEGHIETEEGNDRFRE